jgi:hypothetical protein
VEGKFCEGGLPFYGVLARALSASHTQVNARITHLRG